MKRKFNLLMVASTMVLGLMLGACGESDPVQPDPDVPVNPDPDKPGPDNPDPEKPAELPAKYDLLKYWSGHMEETVYEVTENETSTVINYTDVKGENAGGWEYVNRPFAFDAKDIARFGVYKTLTFTGKLNVTAGSDVTMVKIEGADGNTIERKFNFGPEEKTYELSLTTITDWTKVSSLLLFANRSTSEMGSGTMTFTEFALSKAEINPENDIAADMPKVPQDVNLYNGGEKLTVMNSWGYDDKGAIKTEARDGGYYFTYGEGSKATEEWAFVKARIKSGTEELATSGLTRIHFTIKGTKGTNALIKFEALGGLGAKEFMINNFTGELEEYDLDVTELVKKVREDGTEPEFIAAVFPAAGKKGADLAGEVFLKDCFMDKTKAIDPNTIYDNVREGDLVKVTKIQNQEAVYTVKTEGTKITVDYKLENVPDYKAMKINVKGENLNELTEIAFNAKSTADVEILVKAYDTVEKRIVLKANEAQDVKFPFDAKIVAEGKPTILFIGTSAESSKEGTLEINNFVFQKPTEVTPEPEVPTHPTNKVENGKVVINQFYSDVKDLYKVEQAGNTTKVTYDKSKGNGWDALKFKVEGEGLDGLKLVTGTIKSNAETSLIFKMYDNNGAQVELKPLKANEEYKLNLVIPAEVDLTKECLIFMGWADEYGKAATVEFTNLQLRRNLPYCEPANGEIAINKFHSYNADLFTITTEGNKTTIAYDKTDDWANIQFSIDGENLDYYNYLTGTITSTVKTSLIIKCYDGNELKIENPLLEANTPTPISKVLTSINSLKNGFIFVGFSGDSAKAGSVTFENLKLTHYVPKCTPEGNVIKINQFHSYNKDYFTITTEGNRTTIAYDKADDWANIQFTIDGENLKEYTKLTGTITADVQTSFIIKCYDANEVKIEAEPLMPNVPQQISTTLTSIDGNKNGFIFMGFAGTSAKKGTIVLENLQLSK